MSTLCPSLFSPISLSKILGGHHGGTDNIRGLASALAAASKNAYIYSNVSPNFNMIQGEVISVSKSATHSFSKLTCSTITLIKGVGVEGDAHSGKKVKHRSRVAKDPNQPNLRQVHLIHSELFEELKHKGFHVQSGEIGENITTSGINLLELPKHTILSIGKSVKIKVTGLRNPCKQLDLKQIGLMKAVLDKDEDGNLIRKAGIMGIVQESGEICVGDKIDIEFPTRPFSKLERV